MSQPHERLSEAMRQRGLQLGKRWVHIAKEAGITTSALGAIRRGEYRPSAHTAAALDGTLGWESGSVEAILDGGEPIIRERPVQSPMDEAEAMMDENEEIAARLVERIRRLRRDQRRLVEDLVRMLEADSAATPDHRSKAR